jgi:hypothetical protein
MRILCMEPSLPQCDLEQESNNASLISSHWFKTCGFSISKNQTMCLSLMEQPVLDFAEEKKQQRKLACIQDVNQTLALNETDPNHQDYQAPCTSLLGV